MYTCDKCGQCFKSHEAEHRRTNSQLFHNITNLTTNRKPLKRDDLTCEGRVKLLLTSNVNKFSKIKQYFLHKQRVQFAVFTVKLVEKVTRAKLIYIIT